MFPPPRQAPVPDLNEKAAADVEEAVRKHVHAYNQQMGSPCKVSGCDAVRTTLFVKRGKKKP